MKDKLYLIGFKHVFDGCPGTDPLVVERFQIIRGIDFEEAVNNLKNLPKFKGRFLQDFVDLTDQESIPKLEHE